MKTIDKTIFLHHLVQAPCDVKADSMKNKLALLWGEAQKKIAYSYLKVT